MTSLAASELDSVQYLYLRELSEPRDNSLRLVVEEAVVNHPGVVRVASELLSPELTSVLKEASPIEHVEGCRVFEIYWKRYAAYLVTEELVGSSAANGYHDESYTGRILRVYSKSHFLDYLARDTGGHTDQFQHYKLICLNHPDRRGSVRASRSSPACSAAHSPAPHTVADEKSPFHLQLKSKGTSDLHKTSKSVPLRPIISLINFNKCFWSSHSDVRRGPSFPITCTVSPFNRKFAQTLGVAPRLTPRRNF